MKAVAMPLLSLPARERACLVEAALCLLLVRLAFGLLAFRLALRLLRITPGDVVPGRIAATDAAEVGRAIACAARHLPFRAVCLQQAFAASLMLRRRGLAATVHLGLARADYANGLAAHAWSRCGEVLVTGAEAAPGFVAVAAFTA
jgi:Transglutaminase-like superfamily